MNIRQTQFVALRANVQPEVIELWLQQSCLAMLDDMHVWIWLDKEAP